MTAAAPTPPDPRPSLFRDPSFHGMTATQFLGAFNDNLFKQLVLVICVDHVVRNPGAADQQGTATAIFAIPFVLFSGVAGWLADRTSKQRIVVLAKVAEIAITLLGLGAFLLGAARPELRFVSLFVVLFCMSTHSAFFGPAKYGILPEMLREGDLPQANGLIQMTTFVAIIFGTALAGFAKERFADELWVVSGMCVTIAVAGTLTSLLVRRTPIAQPGLPLRWSSLAIDAATWRMLRTDRPLFGVLLVSSLFWFLGGVVQQGVNALGKLRLGFSDGRTSLLVACLGVGIAAGCLVAGKASRKRIEFRLVTCGAWGMIVGLIALMLIGWIAGPLPVAVEAPRANVVENVGPPEPLGQLLLPASAIDLGSRIALTGLGFAAGLFVVPLQVFMQTRPPDDRKGRMIGAMNLVNWIGILLSAAFYGGCNGALRLLDRPPGDVYGVFAVLAALLLPIAVRYRPRSDVTAQDIATGSQA